MQTGGPPTLNVRTVAGPISDAPTYNNVQTTDSLFGTVTVLSGQSAVINSEACPVADEGLGFVFEYADWATEASSVEWTQYINPETGGAGDDLRGVYVNYNC